ncbi:MAG TPA: hypothetical protein VIG33_17730 [Pseudobdellovibrionaceae bacterium]
MSILKFLLIMSFIFGWVLQSNAQSIPTVEWYPPETEKSQLPNRSKVVISGRTTGGSLVQIDGDSVTVINEKAPSPTNSNVQPSEAIRQLRANCKVYMAPDIKTKVLASMKKGDDVKAVEFADSWLKVFLKTGPGFMSRPCVVPLKEQAKETSPGSFKIDNRFTRANIEGFFEIAIELPEGRAQIPILVTSPSNAQKTFLVSVNVSINANNNVDDIKMNTKVSQSKPPAAAKKIRLWLGAGLTFQNYGQTMDGAPDLKFQTVQSPGIVARGGYWGDRWGIDFYFRDAPGKIEAEAPLQIQSDTYHWRTAEAKGLYQFARGPSSRIGGRPSQWQLRFGTQLHQIPFLEVSDTNRVTIKESSLQMATLGGGLLLGQEQDLSYEFAVGIQYPLSASGPGKSFSVSSPFGYEAQIGAAHKFASNWRLGLFSYTQSLAYSYKYENTNGALKNGQQDLFYTTLDLRLGYEF